MYRVALLYLLVTVASCRFYTAENVFPNLTISKADPYDYVYGIVNSTVDATFTVTNEGDGPATNIEASISNTHYQFKGGSFPGTGGTCSSSIGVKESCTIVVQFSPTAIADRIQATLNLSYLPSPKNDRLTASKVLIGDSIYGATLTISDGTAYDYGRVSIATPSDKTFTITNTGTHAASQLQASVLTSNYSLPGGGTCGSTLAAGATCAIIVRFSPTQFIASSDTFSISYNNTVETATASRALTGTGVGASGTVDTTFATGGIALTSMGASKETLQNAYIDTSSRLYLVGTYDYGIGTNGLAIVRYTGGGVNLDTSFFTNGIMTATISGLQSSTLQTDGKVITHIRSSKMRWNADGTQDTAFSTYVMTVGLIGNYFQSYAMLIQTDGKSVVTGTAAGGSVAFPSLAVGRYLTNGQLDTSFSTDGYNMGFVDHMTGKAVTEQTVGGVRKTVAVGMVDGDFRYNGNCFAVVRINESGTFDTSFATSGQLCTTIGTGNNSVAISPPDMGATTVMINGTNQVVVGGEMNYSPVAAGPDLYSNWGMLLLDSSGAFVRDSSSAASQNQSIRGVTINSGNIKLAGSSSSAPANQMVIENARATRGEVSYGNGDDQGVSVLLSTGTTYLLLGHAQTLVTQNQNYDFAFAQLKTTDVLDTSFNTSGKKTLNLFNAADARITQVLVQTDGKALGFGIAYWGGQYSLSVARYDTNGNLDTSFMTTGYLLQSFSSATSPYTVSGLLQTNGRITLGALFNSTSRLITFKTDGTLDTSFYTTGLSDSATPPTTVREFSSIRQGTDGLFYGVGNANNNFFIQRYTANGRLDTSFNTVGYWSKNAGGVDGINALAFDGNGGIWGAGYTNVSGNYDFVLAHFYSDGSVDTSFQTQGYVINGVGTSDDYGNSILIDSAGKIVISGSSTQAHTMTGHLRFLTTGILDTTFSTDGKLLISYGNTAVIGTAGTILDSSGYLIGGFSLSAAPHSFGLYRINSSGNLDTFFTTGGFALTTIAGTNGAATSIAPLSDGKYLLGGYAYQTAPYRNPVLIRLWP